jgi:hypothetical protein
MRSSLLDFEPEVYRLLPPVALPARAVELELTTELLERVDSGTPGVDDEGYIVELIDDAVAGSTMGRPRRLSRPMAGALAHVLGLAARRVLRQRRAARMGAVGRLFALELEGLSPEDQLFEVTRQFVRLIQEAARRAVPLDDRAVPLDRRTARSAFTVDRDAHRAVHGAALELAPGLAPLVAAHRGTSPTSFSPTSVFAGGAIPSSSVPPRRGDIARSWRVRSLEGV